MEKNFLSSFIIVFFPGLLIISGRVIYLLQLVLRSIYGITIGFYLSLFRLFFSYVKFKILHDNIPPVIRSQPVNSFRWGTDTVISVRFNPGEPNVFATTARYA